MKSKLYSLAIFLLAALILPGLVAQDTSAIFSDSETSTNSISAYSQQSVLRLLVSDQGSHTEYIYHYGYDGSFVNRFELVRENHQPVGVAHADQVVYVLDKVSRKIYQYSLGIEDYGTLLTTSREMKDSWNHQVSSAGGLAIDSENDEAWIVDNSGYLFCYSLTELFSSSSQPLSASRYIELCRGSHGGHYYTCDEYEDFEYSDRDVDDDDGDTRDNDDDACGDLDTEDVDIDCGGGWNPGYSNGNPEGLAIDDQYLYVVDSAVDRFFRYDRQDGSVTVSASLEREGRGQIQPTGALCYNGSLWIIDRNGQRAYEYSADDLFENGDSADPVSYFDLHSENTHASGV